MAGNLGTPAGKKKKKKKKRTMIKYCTRRRRSEGCCPAARQLTLAALGRMDGNMTSNPYMCGSTMGMVFCSPNYSANSGTGFSLLFSSWVISSRSSYVLALLGVAAMGARRQLAVALRRALSVANRAGAGGGSGGEAAEGLLQQRKERRSPLACAALTASPRALIVGDAALCAAALALSYLNLLVAMASAAGLLAALVAGEALTYGALRAASAGGGGGSGAATGSTNDDAACHE